MIPLHKVRITAKAIDRIKETLYSGTITEGPRVKEFESRLAEYLGTRVLATNSCTSAIDLALHLCGVENGDEVVSTPMTCAATNTHVLLRGAKLVWADISPRTGNIDTESIVQSVSPKTKAILVVDWGGRPVDCRTIRQRIPDCPPIIQDAAHSFGALQDGKPAHSHADSAEFVAWSFQAIKHLTTGDGGALKVPAAMYNRARALRWFGIDRETKAKFRFLQDIPEPGFKYHMNDLAATLGLANLDQAIEDVETHRKNASRLFALLSTCRNVQLPPPSEESSWWFYSLLTTNWEQFVEFLETRGIGSGPVHGRNDAYSSYKKSEHPLRGVDYYASRHVAIPCGWWLTYHDIEHIGYVVRDWDGTL